MVDSGALPKQAAEKVILQPQALKRVFQMRALIAALEALRHPKPDFFPSLLG